MAGWRGLATTMQPALARPVSTTKQLSGVTSGMKPPTAMPTGNRMGIQSFRPQMGIGRLRK